MSLTVSEWWDGEGRLFTCVVRDVTLQKETQAQLLQTQKMESLSQLSSGLAHDFNNLLAIIIGNLDVLEGARKYGGLGLEQIQSALRAAERGAEITNKMLRFSRAQVSSTETLAPQNVTELLREMVEILRRTLGPTLEVKLECQKDPLWVALDSVEFEMSHLIWV